MVQKFNCGKPQSFLCNIFAILVSRCRDVRGYLRHRNTFLQAIHFRFRLALEKNEGTHNIIRQFKQMILTLPRVMILVCLFFVTFERSYA